jgi:type IV pilus biogenesis protein CpaD/CtpE
MKKIVVIAVVAGLAGGCASEPSRLDAKFGTSVKQTLVQQTYNPGASQANASKTEASLDGQKAATALENYRKPERATVESRSIRGFDFSD